MSYKQKYNEYWKQATELAKELKEFNQKHAHIIADNYLNDILDIEGIEGCRILESGSPEDMMESGIRIYVKLSEKASEPNDEYDDGNKYFSFYRSSFPDKIKDIIGEEYDHSMAIHISDGWDLGKPSGWQELIVEKEN